MPHSSLACKQLKAQGLVHRDESSGLRNAPFSLTSEGLLRLEADAVAKIGGHFDDVPRERTGVVLQAEGKDVLVGYIEQPDSSILFIPEHKEWVGEGSKGNQGGWWIHAPPEETKWYDLKTLDPSPAPVSTDTVVLASFTASRTVGLVRARLIETSASTSLVRGRWFSSRQGNHSPSMMTQGNVVIGSVPGTSLLFAPPSPCRAVLPTDAERHMVVNAYSESSVVLTDAGSPSVNVLPYAVLLPWLVNRHPRMTKDKRLDLWSGLVTALGEERPAKGALERAVVADFGSVRWADVDLTTGLLDTREMKITAVLAILEHLRDAESVPFVVDWGGGLQDAARLEKITDHPGCLAVIQRTMLEVPPLPQGCVVTPHPEFGVVKVEFSGMNFTLRLRLNESGYLRSIRFPASAMELQHATSSSTLNPDQFTSIWPTEHRSLYEQALFAYPQGDERLASRVEHSCPLAAWIASPSKERPHRALRLAPLLPRGWLELITVEELPVHMIPDVLEFAGPAWQAEAIDRYATASHHDTSLLEPLAVMLQADPPHPSAALLFLCTPQHRIIGLASLFERAANRWWSSPSHVTMVLATVFDVRRNEPNQAVLDDWLVRSQAHQANDDLRQWCQVLSTIKNDEPFQVNLQRSCMERFPFSWWMGYAQPWLVAQLASASGRAWLAQHFLPWGAILARTQGERCGVPGAPMHHPGLTLSASDLLGIRLVPEGPGLAPLTDLLTMMQTSEQGQPVPRLLTHPDGGWLVRPVSHWPLFTQQVFARGCLSTAQVLLGRQYAAKLDDQR